jgi:glutamyl-tRNA reductase
VTRALAIWAAVAAADRISISDREELARLQVHSVPRPDRAALVTCHRVETYGVDDPADADRRTDETALPFPIVLRGEDAVRHLFRLAVGLESAVLGEDQVLHQVRLALAEMCARHADPRLIRLFEIAVGVGRRARAEHPAADRNLGELAVRWVERRAGPLAGRDVVVAGAGRMGRLAAGAFARRRARVTVVSRTPERAVAVAERVGGRAADLASGATGAASPGVWAVVVALRGPWTGFAPERSVPVVDLSFPLAVPDAARNSLGDAFADVDRIFREARELQSQGVASRDFRTAADAIVDEAVLAYRGWSAGRASVATLRALRDRSEEQRSVELERLLRRLPDLEPRERELVAAFSQHLVAGLLHRPSAALRDDVDGSVAIAAERLFGL